MRRQRRFLRSSSPRRKYHWEEARASSGGLITHDAGVAGGLSTVQVGWIREPAGRISPSSGLLIEDDCTLMTTLVSAQVEAAGQTGYTVWPGARMPVNAYFGWGMLVWEGIDGANTPTLFDVPWPVSGAGPGDSADWLWKQVTAFTSYPLFAPTALELTARVKSQRKLSSGMGILLVTEMLVDTAAGDGGSNFYIWQYQHRQLFKGP